MRICPYLVTFLVSIFLATWAATTNINDKITAVFHRRPTGMSASIMPYPAGTFQVGQHVLVDYADPGRPDDIRTYPAQVLVIDAPAGTFDCVWIASGHQVSRGLPISSINTTGTAEFVGFGSTTNPDYARSAPALSSAIDEVCAYSHILHRLMVLPLDPSPPRHPLRWGTMVAWGWARLSITRLSHFG